MTDFSAQVSALIAYFGETVILRKVTAGTLNAGNLQASPTSTDYSIKAAVRFYRPQEIAGMVQEGDRQVKIASDDVTVVPHANDKIIIGSGATTKILNIVSVNARSAQNAIATYILQVRG